MYRDSRDEHELLDILRLHGLVAINRFHDPKTFTYTGADSQTQLDYIFMRSNQAVGLSKQAKGLHHFPLLAARGDGFHVPILARSPSRWRVWSFKGQTTQQKGSSRTETSIYINANPRALVPHLGQALQDGFTDIGSLDEALHQVQQYAVNTMQQRRDQALRLWQDGDLRTILRQAWMHLRRARSQAKKKLCNLFQAWKHIHQFGVLIKTTRKNCRRLRRQQLLGILNNARYQAHNHNISGIFKLVDRLAPKRNRSTPQMRDSKGMLLDTEQEAEATAQYLRSLSRVRQNRIHFWHADRGRSWRANPNTLP